MSTPASLKQLREGVAARPGDLAAWEAYIEALIEAGHPALADHVLQQAQAAGLPRAQAQPLAARISVGDAPEPEEIAALVALFNERDFVQLEQAAAVMARRYPQAGMVWRLLGTGRLLAGRAAEAVTPLQKAAAAFPGDADLRVNLANALRGAGQLDEAELQLHKALKLSPRSAVLHASLGNLHRERRRPREAEASYRHALKLQPDLAGARQNLGVVLSERGALAEAEQALRQAIAAEPSVADGWINLATLLQNTQRVREAQDLLAQGLRSVAAGHWMLGSLALTGCWLLRDTANAAHLFQAFQQQAAGEEAFRADRALREFFWLSARLFDAMARDPQLYAPDAAAAALHVLGESHSLVPAHAVFGWRGERVQAQARLVKGVKMFHLGQAEANGFDAALKLQLQQVPVDAHLLLAIGEIDCRADEGLWPAAQKGRGELAALVRGTVEGYLAWVERNVATRGLRSLTLQGVPAPAKWPAERAEFLAMVAQVDALLREGCATRGWGFLDVHAASATADGAANGQWHIDEFHLKPQLYARAGEWLR